ncbi:MAG: ArnT family glycosyltransferase [Saccharofermentanales bacterium]
MAGFLEKSQKTIKSMIKKPSIMAAAACLFLAFGVDGTTPKLAIPIMAGGLFFIICMTAIWVTRKKLDTGKIIFTIAFLGFLIKTVYIIYTGVETRQQDVYTFGEPEGHAGYIEYIYHNLRLPDFDPRNIWQYYHPPFHHILVVIWLKINTLFGIGWDRAKENIQVLTLFYSALYMIVSLKLFREIGFKKYGLIIAFAIVSFHPAFIILAGSVNNDILAILLMQCAIYYTIRWYKEPVAANMIKVALCIGFGMMTKLSVGIIAPAIAFVFLYHFFTDKEKRADFFRQFIAFAVICVPLALWWGFRNKILFDVPFMYVPSLGINSHQYIGNYSTFQRLLDFSLYQFKSVFVAWGDPYFEHNVFIGLLKSAVFGEQHLGNGKTFIELPAIILFYSNLVVVAISVVSMIWGFFKRLVSPDSIIKTFIILIYLTIVTSYIQFCFSFPHTCTQNIRYATPAIFIGAVFIGLFADRLSEMKKGVKTISLSLITAAVIVFAGATLTFYTALAFA